MDNLRGRKRRGGFPILGVLYTALGLFALILLLSSSLFDIKNIVITGNNVLSREEIIEMAGLGGGKNIFLVNTISITKSLEASHYVKSVEADIIYPSEVRLNIVERKVRSLVEFGSIFLHVDEEGMVLGVSSTVKEPLPIVTGLKISDFSEGQFLSIDNPSSFESVVSLNKLFEKYEIGDVLKVDISDADDIHIFINGLDISFGSISDANEKIRRIKYILDEIPKNDRGYLDASDVTKNPVFRYLN